MLQLRSNELTSAMSSISRITSHTLASARSHSVDAHRHAVTASHSTVALVNVWNSEASAASEAPPLTSTDSALSLVSLCTFTSERALGVDADRRSRIAIVSVLVALVNVHTLVLGLIKPESRFTLANGRQRSVVDADGEARDMGGPSAELLHVFTASLQRIRAFDAVSFESSVAFTLVRALCVGALSQWMAWMLLVALIDVSAHEAVASESRLARAGEGSVEVDAVGVRRACRRQFALVDVFTSGPLLLVPAHALPTLHSSVRSLHFAAHVALRTVTLHDLLGIAWLLSVRNAVISVSQESSLAFTRVSSGLVDAVGVGSAARRVVLVALVNVFARAVVCFAEAGRTEARVAADEVLATGRVVAFVVASGTLVNVWNQWDYGGVYEWNSWIYSKMLQEPASKT